uniref:Myb-like domain-containing protein n=1 Tax=Kalanchoe fedtschenkoi TaxID=63787 RepID=A0A7N0T652_KALFE
MESQLDPQAPAPAASWTRADDKQFESLLVEFPEGCANRFESVASRLPGRSVDEVVKRYEDLVADVEAIEAGLIPHPKYGGGDRRNEGSHLQKAPTQRKNTSSKWTEDEHK